MVCIMEKFSNGTPITPYLATANAEGFGEGEMASAADQLKAWSYIGKTGLYRQLQGFFGRTLRDLILDGWLDKNFNILRLP